MNNILIVISTPELGGAQRVAINLAEWFSARHLYNTLIVSLNKSKRNTYNLEQLDYVCLDGKNIISKLRSIIKSRNIDLVLTMGVPLCVYTVPACLFTRVKHIVSERNDPANFAGKKSTKFLSRLLMKKCHGFVFQTKDAQNYYSHKIAKQSVIIHNPLLNCQIQHDADYGNREKCIVSVGRLNVQKNQRLLLEAIEKVHNEIPDYKLIIYGEGPERGHLESYIEKNNMEGYVQLPGSTLDVIDRIKSSSLFILSSDFEGMPNALMEAMSVGLPCISTDCPCGGPAALINSGTNGILIPLGDTEELAKQILIVIRDREYAKKLGNNAFKINETHSIDNIGKQWADYISSIIKN